MLFVIWTVEQESTYHFSRSVSIWSLVVMKFIAFYSSSASSMTLGSLVMACAAAAGFLLASRFFVRQSTSLWNVPGNPFFLQ